MDRFINFALSDKSILNLKISDNVFVPTATTNFLIDAVKNNENNKKKILDLGCGTGIVGIALRSLNLGDKIYASDLSDNAARVAQFNFNKYNIKFDVRAGSLFQPWENETFDLIVDDISGISDEVAKLSSWFDGISCDSGVNGSDLTVEIIRNASKYLDKFGSLYFPIISLSNESIILKEANKHFKNIELVSTNNWPMPKELVDHIIFLEELKKAGHIDFSDKFGMKICWTKIFKIGN